MEIQFVLTADYAMRDPGNGKLHLLGIFNTLWSREFPLTVERMCIVTKIRSELHDLRRSHRLFIRLADEDGVDLLDRNASIYLPDTQPGIEPDYIHISELNGFVFPRPGVYRCYATLNDNEAEESVALQINRDNGI